MRTRGHRRAVGIDLGTTHTVVAWAELDRPAPPRIFEIPQLVTPTEIEARPLFPSFLYAPLPGEISVDPWGDAPWVAGALARKRGGEVPGRLVASAKSWLCHPSVDRSAAILPWGASEDDTSLPHISPLDASARYLAHVRRAWDEAFPETPLAEQEVVLTVPASFDEVARELTLEAATRAGLRVRLLEEPQAAFYDYMVQKGERGLESLLIRSNTALVLVCDIGGGTTDLSLIEVARGEGEEPFDISRLAVGRHLLLGGDNMDLALAHLCEARLLAPGTSKLDAARFGQLVLACRAAKEKLLGHDPPDEIPIAIAGQGARLVGGTLTTRLTRDEAERVVLEGFFPRAARDARPARARGGLVAFGLPYERDAAITRHIANFFARHAPEALGPDAILFNGGVFRATRVAACLADTIQSWGGPPLETLPHADPDIAVARGAVAYALAIAGRGLRIHGGAARGYYLGLELERDSQTRRAICVVPRGAEEGVPQIAHGRTLALVVGRPVRFDLFASDETHHQAGEIVPLDDERYESMPPVAVSFEAEGARRGPKEVEVELEGELSAIGTLELACVETGDLPPQARRRFRLAFQLRPDAEPQAPTAPSEPPLPPVRAKKLDDARETIERVFGKGRADVTPRQVKDLLRDLERILGERASWTTRESRALFDVLAPNHRARKRSADHERLFWLLSGYCIRPGFGDPEDARRIELFAPLFGEKVAFSQEPRNWQQFWIAWRRAAGGLDEATQTAIRDILDPLLAPATLRLKRPKGWKPEAEPDLLDLASSLERVPSTRRSELGSFILERTWTDRDPRLWAAIGRLGARVPAYASVHHVVSPLIAERWLDHLLREKWETLPTAAQAAVQLARVTDDRARDISERLRGEVARRLEKVGARQEWIRAVREYVAVEEAERAAFFGEGLPVGLRLLS